MKSFIVDIGNTDIVFGYYQQGVWQHTWRHPSSNDQGVAIFLEGQLKRHKISSFELVVLSSVVPAYTEWVSSMLTHLTGIDPIVIGPSLFRRLEIQIQQPNEIGSDLVANAFAAWSRYRTACIAVDFGTALTFTAVSQTGDIEGVAITPGLKTAAHALFQNAARLPEIPLELPETAIGKSTTHAIQSGILLGYVGLVKEMLARISQELGGACTCVATGGLSSVLTPLHSLFDEVDPMLTLDGLRLLGEWEQSSSE